MIMQKIEVNSMIIRRFGHFKGDEIGPKMSNFDVCWKRKGRDSPAHLLSASGSVCDTFVKITVFVYLLYPPSKKNEQVSDGFFHALGGHHRNSWGR